MKTPEEKKAYLREYYKKNKKRLSRKMAEYRKTHKEEAKKYSKEWRQKNKESLKKKKAAHYQKNKEKIQTKRRLNHVRVLAYQNKRRQNPKIKLNAAISESVRYCLKHGKNGLGWEELVGYTLNQLVEHIEKLFQPGMTWANYGKWHIDHKIPVSAFNFSNPKHLDFKRCWALSNLQPLWAKENVRKYNKIKKPFQPSLTI